MPSSRRAKTIVWTIVGASVLGGAWFAHGFHRAWRRFASEERLCGAFHPVIEGIARFREATGALPAELAELVPEYASQLPAAPVADSIEYRVTADGASWQLTVHSRVTGDPRIYIQRSSHEFTEEERRRSVTAFHGWVGYRE